MERLAIERNAETIEPDERRWSWLVETIGRTITGSEETFEDALQKASEVATAHGVGG